jgi:hypothetical protein
VLLPIASIAQLYALVVPINFEVLEVDIMDRGDLRSVPAVEKGDFVVGLRKPSVLRERGGIRE